VTFGRTHWFRCHSRSIACLQCTAVLEKGKAQWLLPAFRGLILIGTSTILAPRLCASSTKLPQRQNPQNRIFFARSRRKALYPVPTSSHSTRRLIIVDRSRSERGRPCSLFPRTRSARSSAMGCTRSGISHGSCWPSASSVTTTSCDADLRPISVLLTNPRFAGFWMTVAPAALAILEVMSVLASSTTMTSSQYRLQAWTISPTVLSSLCAGITAETFKAQTLID
jgi:hypothetical protein